MIEPLKKLAHQYLAYGFGLMFNKQRQTGLPWNAKRVYRVYCLLKIKLRRKVQKRLPNRYPQSLAIPLRMNHCWSVGFMREADLNIPAHRIFRIMERVSAERGYPAFIRSDNAPELTAGALAKWAECHSVILDYSARQTDAERIYRVI